MAKQQTLDEARFAADVKFAEDQLIEAGVLAPMFIIKNDNSIVPLLPDFSSADAKRQSTIQVKLIAVAINATSVTLMSEAWSVTMPVGESLEGMRPPSEREDRREVLLVSCHSRNSQRMVSAREILRGDDAKVIGFGPNAEEFSKEAKSMQGGMADLLPPHIPTAQEQKFARDMLSRFGIELIPENRIN